MTPRLQDCSKKGFPFMFMFSIAHKNMKYFQIKDYYSDLVPNGPKSCQVNKNHIKQTSKSRTILYTLNLMFLNSG